MIEIKPKARLTRRDYSVAALTSQAYILVIIAAFVTFLALILFQVDLDSPGSTADVLILSIFVPCWLAICAATIYTLHIFNRLAIERLGFSPLDRPITVVSWTIILLNVGGIIDSVVPIRDWLMTSNSQFSNLACKNDPLSLWIFFCILQLGFGLIWFSYSLRKTLPEFPRLGLLLIAGIFITGLSLSGVALAHLSGDEGRSFAQIFLISYLGACATLTTIFLSCRSRLSERGHYGSN